MSGYPYEMQLLGRMVLALVCGSVLGYERERHGISAGLMIPLARSQKNMHVFL